MELRDEGRWEELRQRTRARDLAAAPATVVVAVEAAVGGEEILASLTRYDSSGPTVWSCWALTQRALAAVEVEYDQVQYDLAAEQSGGNVEPNVRQVWCRPLASVAKLDYGHTFATDLRRGLWFPAGPITVTFNDGTAEDIPAKGGFSYSQTDDRNRLDEFLQVLRKGF